MLDFKLKILEKVDVTINYVDWFKNEKVTKFSDNQYKSHTLESQLLYVENCLKDDNIALFGIFINKKHIGNITLNGLKSFHKRAEISYLIGETSFWGKGIGQLAIKQIINFSKNEYNLNKLFAGVVEDNLASRKILEKNGFKLEGIREKHLKYNGQFFNQLDYGLIL